MMRQKIITLILIGISVILLTFIFLGSRNKKNTLSLALNTSVKAPILFYGVTCPHCFDLEEWLKNNKVEEKIQLIKKEVYQNQANSQELEQLAQKCGLDVSSIGVPFLFTDEGKCLIGKTEIINYLEQKIGLNSTNQ